MKLIHCADLHLDSAMSSHLDKIKAKERKNELLRNFSRMIDYAENNGITAILMAGDVFDKKTISVTARKTVYGAMLEHKDITFYYLPGNHDKEGFFETLDVWPENLKAFEDKWTSYKVGSFKGKDVILSGVYLTENNINSIYTTLALNMDDYNIVTLHGQTEEYKCTEKDEYISLSSLRDKGIDYLALGHVHAYREEKLDSRGVYCYSGCLEGRGFDEAGEHGFVVIDFDEEKGLVEREFIPFARRHIYVLPVDISEASDNYDIEKKIKHALESAKMEEFSAFGGKCISEADLVKIELTGNVSVETEKDLDYLEARFSDAFYFFKVKDLSHYSIDYKDYENDISLKGEFIRNVMCQEDLTEEMKAEIINFGIKALKGSLQEIL